MGPCMCGDTYCRSCGPAQGNDKCPHCGAWTMDGGCADPAACEKAERAMVDGMAAQFEEDAKLEAEAKRRGVKVWDL